MKEDIYGWARKLQKSPPQHRDTLFPVASGLPRGGTLAARPKNSLALNHAFHFLFWGH